MPLVSMSRRTRLPENIEAMNITLTPEEASTLNKHFAPGAITGGTYLQR
jgi:aryl-alcohol dehydrogenase-like predicted oxidoreductase